MSRGKKGIVFGNGLLTREKVTGMKGVEGIEGVTGLITPASFKGPHRELQVVCTALIAVTKLKGPLSVVLTRVARATGKPGTARGMWTVAVMEAIASVE